MTPSDYAISGDYGDQLALDPGMPTAGDTYRNIHTLEISTVLQITQRSYCWVKFRKGGRESELPLNHFLEHYQPYTLPVPGL
jgi:hypothetical protein